MPDEQPEEGQEVANPLSPATPQAITRPKLLLGEGDEEVYFFNALLRHLRIEDVQVEQVGGKGNYKNFIITLPKRPGFLNVEAVAITWDADDNMAGAFQSVCSSLNRAGLEGPQAAATYTTGRPRIGVFIMPNCSDGGMLEDLCIESIANDIAMPCVDAFLRCVEAGGRRPNNLAKAKVHAWLASQVRPDKRLGEAAQAGYWNWGDPAFNLLKQFLIQL